MGVKLIHSLVSSVVVVAESFSDFQDRGFLFVQDAFYFRVAIIDHPPHQTAQTKVSALDQVDPKRDTEESVLVFSAKLSVYERYLLWSGEGRQAKSIRLREGA